jgi:uncharacterized protein YgfB (UPF0149 family)
MVDCLSERQLKVVQHIKNHPGITKAALIRDLKGQYSRVTLFNVLKNLQDQKIIYVERDKVNSQIHHLFTNDDDIVTNQLDELDQFEKAFFPLLERVREEVLKVYPEVIEKLERYHNLQALKDATTIEDMNEIIKETEFKEIIEPYFLRTGMFVQCIRIFRQLLQLYIVRSIFVWPIEIEDTKRLDLITSALFSRIVNIQLKMTKIISETSSPYQDKEFKSKGVRMSLPADPTSTVIRTMIDNWKNIEVAQEYLEGFGLQKETRPVVELLSNIRKQIQELSY